MTLHLQKRDVKDEFLRQYIINLITLLCYKN